jgi:hypothetical protein
MLVSRFRKPTTVVRIAATCLLAASIAKWLLNDMSGIAEHAVSFTVAMLYGASSGLFLFYILLRRNAVTRCHKDPA